ncbi:maltokinase N-terminal cap-like domain-containing protein [Streptomyces xantholiticus]|uniref:maltokinase N-terminal cap-like domain-containing protein n=1 Tax=Streptomyces xantholiticus TaxID=68285 RepID=UPI001678D3B9|nr:1,4-alpha-glucan branching protein [Streptomyces xantholiticus]GGW53054.1 hypothetical protein GCM10010381_43070 [Streptomyces xantholiticus]
MAVIHTATMAPGKLELLAAWLPAQPWYLGTAGEPELTKAGGFRLDDPQGEVGIEFMVVTDTSGDEPVSYHLPLGYRGAPLDGADEAALIGTSEHGVLGKRWIYDGAHDPVVVAQLLAFVQGRAEAQAQGVSNTPDPSVTGHFTGPGLPAEVASVTVTDGPDGTDVSLGSAGSDPSLTLTVTRRPEPDSTGSDPAGSRGHVTAGWRRPDGAEQRGRFFLLRDTSL